MIEKSIWREVAEDNGWPDPMLFKNLSPDRTPGYPYSKGGTRNRITGTNPDPFLKDKVFYVGKYPAARREHIIEWLDRKTTREATD
jgi:hypothetical protein